MDQKKQFSIGYVLLEAGKLEALEHSGEGRHDFVTIRLEDDSRTEAQAEPPADLR